MNQFNPVDVMRYAQAIYPPNTRLAIVPYGYSSTFLGLAQNATQTNVLGITANADFILMGIYHRAQIGAAQNVSTKTAPYARLLISDTGSNEQFSAQPVDLENYGTNGGDSRILPYPRWIGGRSSLALQLTNYAPTAETYTSIDVFLEGVLVRAYDSANNGAQMFLSDLS